MIKNYFRLALAALATTALVAAAYFAASYYHDMNYLKNIVKTEIETEPGSGKFVEELNQWVYFNKGFAKIADHYLFQKLGPTPIEILEKGGDCSDKSRLLSAMLSSVGMDSTLVMLYSCESCEPRHTVVEARYNGNRIVADPVYDLVFPKKSGGYYRLEELRDNPELLGETLDNLIIERGRHDKIAAYGRQLSNYSGPRTINWDKNFFTSMTGKVVALFVDEPYLVQRPHFLEDPKLFLSLTCFAISSGLFLLLFFSRKR